MKLLHEIEHFQGFILLKIPPHLIYNLLLKLLDNLEKKLFRVYNVDVNCKKVYELRGFPLTYKVEFIYQHWYFDN